MKIGLYIEHGSGDGVGGAELMMAYVASAWSRAHDVDLIHHRPPLTRERIERFSCDDFSRVNFQYVPREPESPAAGNPLRRFQLAKDWHAAVSDGYDLFVNCTHWLPCFSRAKRSVLLVLFPFYVRPVDLPDIQQLPFWKRWRHSAYYATEWTLRMSTYQRRLAISRFSAEWTRRRWKAATDLVYPPVDVAFGDGPKDDLIVSIGRFSTMAHTKKQLEMMRAFTGLQSRLPASWRYASVGGLNAREENHRYFGGVQQLARDARATVAANVPRAELRGLLERGRIFWHATGLNDDTDRHPELCEHFGISTVEAMAAGCVPVVINKGGQREIVEHGKTGFVWNTIDELQHYTHLLASDCDLRATMSAAARARAREFGRDDFIVRLSQMCDVPMQDLDSRGHMQAATSLTSSSY